MLRKSLTLGKPYESTVPYSFGVVCSGRMLYTSGICARDANGKTVGRRDHRAQLIQCLNNLNDILSAAGGRWEHVVKYTIYTTDIESYLKIGPEPWAGYWVDRPASTLVEVSRLMDPDWLIEIELVACLCDSKEGTDA